MAEPRKVRIRAVPWTTSTADKVKGMLGELPAYVKRARRVERLIEGLFHAAGEAYDERMRFVRIRKSTRSVARFNKRWEQWLDEEAGEAELDAVNEQIEAYNRFFPVERQAAVKHVALHKLDFEPKEPVTRDDLLAKFPFLRA